MFFFFFRDNRMCAVALTVISRSSASELYQSKVRQRIMFMRLTTLRNVLRRSASRTRANHQCRGKHVWDEGHFSIFMQGVFKHVGTKNLHFFMLFLTLKHKRRNSILLLSRNRPHPSLSKQSSDQCMQW